MSVVSEFKPVNLSFEVGDLVECVDNSCCIAVTIGKQYIVESIYRDNPYDPMPLLVITNDEGNINGGYFFYRFKKVEKVEKVEEKITEKSEPTNFKVGEKVESYPIYYKHKDDAFAKGLKYIKRESEDKYQPVLINGIIGPDERLWCNSCSSYAKNGIWVKVEESEVESFIKSTSQKSEVVEEKMKFPIYYKNKTKFINDCIYVKRISKSSYNIVRNNGEIKQFEHEWDESHDRIVKNGYWIEVPEKEALAFIASVTITEANPVLVKEEGKEEMKKETAIVARKTVGKLAAIWGFKAANYWVFEPAKNLGRPIVKGVRYAVFIGGLTSVIYGYNHPEVITNAIKSCVPKITIEAPQILKG